MRDRYYTLGGESMCDVIEELRHVNRKMRAVLETLPLTDAGNVRELSDLAKSKSSDCAAAVRELPNDFL